MTGPVPLRSQLSRFHTNRRDPEQVAREGWKETGIAVINVNDPRLNWADREIVERIASELYGERK